MLLMGTLLHNEIISIPCFGLDRYTRKEVTKEADGEPIEYTPLLYNYTSKRSLSLENSSTLSLSVSDEKTSSFKKK